MTFWTLILGGIFGLVKGAMTNSLPDHAVLGIGVALISMMTSSIGLVFTVALSNFNMALPFKIFITLSIIESARTVYIIWLRIKHIFL